MPSPVEYACAALERLSLITSKNEKIDFLSALDGELSGDVQALLIRALDPWRVYNIKKLPTVRTPPRPAATMSSFLTLCDGLADKTIPANDETKMETALALASSGPLVEKWLTRVLQKDLRAGVTSNTVNKAWKDLIPDFKVMLGEPLKGKGKTVEAQRKDAAKRRTKIRYPALVDQKIDGYRCLVFCDEDGTVYALSRGGKPLNLTWVVKEYARCYAQEARDRRGLIGTVIFDGELYCRDYKTTKRIANRDDLNDLPDDIVDDLRYFVFDCLSQGEWENRKCHTSYADRLCRINFIGVTDGQTPTRPMNRPTVQIADTWEQVVAINKAHLDAGWEGSMVKNPLAPYEWKRSWGLLKLKPHERDDFEILEITESTKMPGHAEHFVIQNPDPKTGTTDASSGGLSHAERRDAWERRAELVGAIVEVEFKGLTDDGRLREPVVKLIREDR